MGILDLEIVRRVRRNHAIEHATIHILTPDYPAVGLAGRADTKGFYLYGPVETEHVRAAVGHALQQLRTHPQLAVHPRCGTNLVVSGFLAGIASMAALATLSEERRENLFLDVMPRLMLAGTAAVVAGQSLGPVVQERCTTLPEVEGVRVAGVERTQRGRHILHRVLLTGDAGP